MRKGVSYQRESSRKLDARIFARNTFCSHFSRSATFSHACSLFSGKTERFSLHEYEATRKNSNSSSLRAGGREIKFRVFLHQLYYIETRKCIRYCERNVGNAPGDAPRCRIFFSFKPGVNFRVFDFSICRVCRRGHFVARAAGYIVSHDRLIRAPARYVVARTPVGTERWFPVA